MKRADELIATLKLERHPERGYFGRTYSAPLVIGDLPHGGPRPVSTAIYFLLTESDRATYLHRLKSDELFHLYEGGPLEVLRLYPDGTGELSILGLDLASGQRPQMVIPAGTWFGTVLGPGASHCLWGCTVAPGFDFADFDLAQGAELAARYPAWPDQIAAMSRAP